MIKQLIQTWMYSGSIPSGLEADTRSLVKAYLKARPGRGHNTFCHAAEVNMLFSQEGQVYVCCHNQSYPIGKYPEQSIREIWNSPAARELREKLRNYDLSSGCKICADDFSRGAFEEVRARHFDTLLSHSQYPVMMEFLLSNVCNLECVMCSGKFSSLIRKNRDQLPPLNTPYDEVFLEQLDEFIPHLKETRFSGSGEAFSIDMNFIIWEKIIQMNPACLIMVQTNGTILSGRVKEVLEKGNFQIGISIDSLDKITYESIRLNANFDKMMDNLLYFRDYARSKGTRFSLSMCVMRQNWQEVPEFIRFCNENNAVATLHKVWHPFKNALFNLPKDELLNILHFYDNQQFEVTNETDHQNVKHFEYYAKVVREWYLNANERMEDFDTVDLGEDFTIYSEEYNTAVKMMNDYISTLNKSNKSECEMQQKRAELRLRKLLALIDDKDIISITLKQIISYPKHEVVDVILYHDLLKLKDDIVKRSYY
jgi:radical SAM protein with 4Fe4S-binding SPASM domain